MMGLDSNLYERAIDSLCPSRERCSTQSCVRSGGSPVQCSPLKPFFNPVVSPVTGFKQATSYQCSSTAASLNPGYSMYTMYCTTSNATSREPSTSKDGSKSQWRFPAKD